MLPSFFSTSASHWSCLFIFHNNGEATQVWYRDLSEAKGAGIFQAPLKTLLASEDAETRAKGLQMVGGWIDNQLHITSLDEAKLEERFNAVEQMLNDECSSNKIQLNDTQEEAIEQMLNWHKLIFIGFKELLEKTEVFKTLLKESFGTLSRDLTQECGQTLPLEELSNFDQILPKKISECEENINECCAWCKQAKQAIDSDRLQSGIASFEAELKDIKNKFSEVKESITSALFELVRLAAAFKALVEEGEQLKVELEFNATALLQEKIKENRSAQYKQLKQIPAQVAQLKDGFQLLLSKAPESAGKTTSSIADEAGNYA